MLTVKINVEGKTESDISCAAREALRLLENGFSSGQGANDDGSFGFFTIDEEERKEIEAALERPLPREPGR